MRQRVDAAPPQTQELPERRPGELQRGVTGARNEPGEAGLARHLPSRAVERPIFLLVALGLVRWLFFFAGSTEANPGSGLLGWVQELFQVFKNELYIFTMLFELAALFDQLLFHLLQLD